MSILRLSLAAIILSATPGAAGEPGAPEAHAKYQLKNRSTFAAAESERPPFWPIGWVKRAAGVTQAPVAMVPRVAIEEKNFVVSSILLGNPALAVINGRSYSEGEFVRMPKDGPKVRVRVGRIGDGAVQLQAEDQMILAKLRREELSPRKFEEEELLVGE